MAQNQDDVLAILRSAVLAVSAVTDVVADRVYTDHIRDEAAARAQSPLVVIAAEQVQDYNSSLLTLGHYHIYAYSALSMAESRSLYQKVKESLHRQGLTKSGLAMKVYGFQEQIDFQSWVPSTSMWATRGYWTFTSME